MQESDLSTGQYHRAKSLVTSLPRHTDGRSQTALVIIDIPKDEMRWPGREQRDNLCRPDISTMQHGLHFKARQHPHRLARKFHLAMRIADHSQHKFRLIAHATAFLVFCYFLI